MRRKLDILIICLLTSYLGMSQNMVTNDGFENYSTLPNGYGQYYKAIGWNNVNGNSSGPPYGSPDYYHTAGTVGPNFGQIAPHSGNGQMGFFTYHALAEDAREYISTQLSSPLVIGQQYQLSFYLTNGTGGLYTGAVDNFGVHLSSSPLTQLIDEVIQVTPQIEIPGIVIHDNYWQKYTFLFIADNASNYITFGNFELDATTTIIGGTRAYYFIDDIELIPRWIGIEIEGDTTICSGTSTLLTAKNDTSYAWADSLAPNVIIGNDSSLLASPTTTTTFFVYGSSDTASITVYVTPTPKVDLGSDMTLCLDGTITLDVSQANATYLWQDNSTFSNFLITQPGVYWVKISIKECTSSDTITISYDSLPQVNLGNDTTMCLGESITLDATYPNVSYQWSNNKFLPTIYVDKTGDYWVKLENQCGSVYDTIHVTIEDCACFLYISNAFTPNGDDLNDQFHPKFSCNFERYHFIILNRWGEQVFRTDIPEESWDGTFKGENSPSGIYIYTLIYKFHGKREVTKQGTVNLMH